MRVLGIAVAMSSAAGCDDDETGDMNAGGHGGSAGHSPEAGSGGEAGAAGSSDVALYGTFTVSLVPAVDDTMTAAMTSILGKVDEGPTPSPAVWSKKIEAAGCVLYTPTPVLCSPACGSSAACVGMNDCAPYPKATSVGTVTLKGLGPTPLSMDPILNNYQPKPGMALIYPPCTEGDSVELQAAGDSHAMFTASAKCISPLEFPGPVKYTRGQSLHLTWTAPGDSKLSKIFLKADLSHHGGSKGKIECEVADTGTLDIPASLTDALVDLGVAGFPTIGLTRKSTGAASGRASNVSLNIASSHERPVEIPGLTSCSEDSDCPSEQKCQTDRSCK